MRGAPDLGSRIAGSLRIIPADAGSTCTWTDKYGNHQDHPRGCGEHGQTAVWNNEQEGSSPRMRGARGGHRHSHEFVGIIPAVAGSTKFFKS